ncbi:hypothetical protein I6F26_04545 [Ensifer sp. IC3342]|nr:hypothetical protein [Ensifer sp. BRP08]MCA1445860.1 hypothetical protein [Ensifer sp. IC3342]
MEMWLSAASKPKKVHSDAICVMHTTRHRTVKQIRITRLAVTRRMQFDLLSKFVVVMRLSVKLPLAAAGMAVLSIAATSLASLTGSGSMSSQATVEKLEALADARRNELRHYLTTTTCAICRRKRRPRRH